MLDTIVVNEEESVKSKTASGNPAHEILLEALGNCDDYSMTTQAAIALLYAGDDRSEDKIKNSFASVKTHCWTKSNWRVEYTDSARKNIAIVGKRSTTDPDKYNPIA